jgi:hypothetical protein
MWYWGEAGRQHRGRVIIVGADNEYIPKLLGYETAKSFAEALEMAKDTHGRNPEMTCMHVPPIGMVDMTPAGSSSVSVSNNAALAQGGEA